MDTTSLNYIKHHKTGEIIEAIKNKDVNRVIKGVAEIEIYDVETGEIETTARTENLLSNKVIWDMLYRQFQNPNSLGDTTWNSSAFTNMVLARYEGVESAELECIFGDVIGWADLRIPVETIEPKQGTLLPQLTTSIENLFKYCVEFSQEKGNGTFDTIYLATAPNNPSSSYADEYGCYMDLKRIENIDYTGIEGVCCCKGDKIYEFSSSNVKIRQVSMANGRKSFNIVNTVQLPTPFQQHAMSSCVYNKTNNVFIVASYNHIAVLDVNTFAIIDEIDTNYVPKLASFGNNLLVAGCNSVTITTIDPVTGLPVQTAVPITNKQLIVLDPLTLAYRQTIDLTIETDEINHIVTDNTETYLYVLGDMRASNFDFTYVFKMVDISTFTLYSRSTDTLDMSELTGLTYINDFGYNMFITGDGLWKSYIEYGCMTKLPSAITKSMGQGMRITYSFSFNV